MIEKSPMNSEENNTSPLLKDVIIIGAGISGLSAAHYLQKQGKTVQIIESEPKVGGRICTEEKEGYLLDRGFQVFLPQYPEAKAILDYDKLNLKPFLPGSKLLLADGSNTYIGDPMRNFSNLSNILFNTPIAYGDLWRLFMLTRRLKNKTILEIFEQPDASTINTLQNEYKFGKSIINNFLQPFFAGIFLENKLESSRRMFDFVFKMFSEGLACVPNEGMQAIPNQLAEKIGSENITLNEEVIEIKGGIVFCRSGKRFEARTVLLASQANAIAKNYYFNIKKHYSSVCHFHYTSDQLPFSEKAIALNTNSTKFVNNLCVIDQIAPGYSKNNEHLISLTIVDEKGLNSSELDKRIRGELTQWFGNVVNDWTLLDAKKIVYALPNQNDVKNNIRSENIKLSDQLYICGDHLLNGSMNAAIKSGRLAARTIVKNLK